MMSSRLLALILEDQQFGTCIELNMCAFLSQGRSFSHEIFSFTQAMRAFYMDTSSCPVVRTHFCFVSSLCFSQGGSWCLYFPTKLVVRVRMYPTNIGCMVTQELASRHLFLAHKRLLLWYKQIHSNLFWVQVNIELLHFVCLVNNINNFDTTRIFEPYRDSKVYSFSFRNNIQKNHEH